MFAYCRTSAAVVCLLFLLSGCRSDSTSPTEESSPAITSFAPASGQVGDTVTITGTNFSTTPANDTVRFNGTIAVVARCTSTQIVTTVPTGATTGTITVAVGKNRATSSTSFTLTGSGPSPTITSFEPSSAQVGDAVTITGTNFSTTPASDTVSFNGTLAVVTSCTSTQIVTSVPAGATTGTITVAVGENRATSSTGFTVTGSRPSFGGYYWDGSTDIACCWTATGRNALPSGEEASAHSPTVSYGGKVYTAGFYWDGGKYVACYWAGGIRTDLPGDGVHNASAFSIAVSGGTVYTAGQYSDGSKETACYWIDTNRTDLSADIATDWSYGTSIAVYGGTIYTGGYYFNGGNYVPCYWIGTTRTDLPVGIEDHWGYVASIAVYNGIAYAAGYYIGSSSNDVACYWIGTTRTDLSGDGTHYANAYAIAVSGGTVYTAGNYYDGTKEIPCYWTGTARTDLSRGAFYDSTHSSNPYARAVTITVAGDTVYTAGEWYVGPVMNSDGISATFIFMPCYWVGTTRTDVGSGSYDAQISSSMTGATMNIER